MGALILRYSWKNSLNYLIPAVILFIIGFLSRTEGGAILIPFAFLGALIGLLSAGLHRAANLYTVTKDFITWRNGILSKTATEIQIKDIRTIKTILNFLSFSMISTRYHHRWKIQPYFFHFFILDINIYGK